MEREIDNVPFIGSITVSPYPLIALSRSTVLNAASRPTAESESAAYYNAASYAIGDPEKPESVALTDYQNLLDPDQKYYFPPLWVTAIGRDGYYPLDILSATSSDDPRILPPIPKPQVTDVKASQDIKRLPPVPIYPSLVWTSLCVVVAILCWFHICSLLVASYWSPFTCDIALAETDRGPRRSMYITIGAAMMFCMAFVLTCPLLAFLSRATSTAALDLRISWRASLVAAITLISGIVAVGVSTRKSWKHVWKKKISAAFPGKISVLTIKEFLKRDPEFIFHIVAWLTMAGVVALWGWSCLGQHSGAVHSFRGLFFSYRCLYPGSGVSPVLPILLLLAAWLLWAFFQAKRLRFSKCNKPMIPKESTEPTDNSYFVSDQDLSRLDRPKNMLFKNITCLFITREVIRRFSQVPTRVSDFAIFVSYTAVFLILAFLSPIKSLDHFLWNIPHLSIPYEFLLTALLVPLLIVALAGWLRLIFVWGALHRGLLEKLENMPIRYAFSRLNGPGWMTMLRYGGRSEQWRDMAHSAESIFQMCHNSDLPKATENAAAADKMETASDDLKRYLEEWRRSERRTQEMEPASRPEYLIAHDIELSCTSFCEGLLSGVLVPYWSKIRGGLVEREDLEMVPLKARRSHAQNERPHEPIELHAGPAANEPPYMLIAEELLALRYVSLIRAVLVNVRYLMTFISLSFGLAIVALNSYPFQPREIINYFFTGVLALFGTGLVWVLTQMHRDPLLSRITHTRPNELGGEFWVRIVSFGAVPVMTWLAYQFPEIGHTIYTFLQPGVDVVK